MIARLLTRPVLLAMALAVLATTAAFAAKPVGFPTYKQCVSKTNCSAQANSDPKGHDLSLTFVKAKCPVIQSALTSGQAWATLHPNHKTGKFSAKKDVQAMSPKDMTYHVVHIKLNGVQKLKKSISGTYTATTDAPDCSAASQKKVKFKLKFAGLAYGG